MGKVSRGKVENFPTLIFGIFTAKIYVSFDLREACLEVEERKHDVLCWKNILISNHSEEKKGELLDKKHTFS
jgi:hypothetical protein